MSHPENEKGQLALAKWKQAIKNNIYQIDNDFQHSISYYLSKKCPHIEKELTDFGDKVVNRLEPLVIENNLDCNLPRLEHYNAIGQLTERVAHHPTYEFAGNIIYGANILERMAKPGGLLEALSFMFLSSQAGEAGHNCPIACSAGIIRVLQKVDDFPQKDDYLDKLLEPSYIHNFTGAQFLTEIQGGSDVGQNASEALFENGEWKISGEKWFCSNANADLMFVTARYDKNIPGTKGLGLFLVPAVLDNGERNNYTIRRLKDKIGTRSMATAEIDFHGAHALCMGDPANGFKLVMENVLHISRIFNSFCVLGMARRAYSIAKAYAENRIAFDKPIIQYPLVKENLARIKAENTALIASVFAMTQMQDDFDTASFEDEKESEEKKLLLRLLANLNKYLSALWSVEHIHHALDVLAGNGAIESFSTIPRLLRDCIVCENWEGTHNVLRMQILKDILKYGVDTLFINHLESTLQKTFSIDTYTEILKAHKKILQQNIERMKSENNLELQCLIIKTIVDQMAILFAATHLLVEAKDQEKSGSRSKFLCFDLFIATHLEKNIVYNQEYINMISAIVA